MTYSLYFIKIILCVLYIGNADSCRIERDVDHEDQVTSKPTTDELIQKTGCKHLHLAHNETAFFTSSDLSRTVMASLLADTTLVDHKQHGFELHFAVRSSPEVHVKLFTRRHYVNVSKTNSDFEVGFGKYDNAVSYLMFSSNIPEYASGMSGYTGTPTKNILSSEDYVKLYITYNGHTLLYGKQCEREPINREESFGYFKLEIVQIGFHTTAINGSDILYDCPDDFADCPCSWRVISNP